MSTEKIQLEKLGWEGKKGGIWDSLLRVFLGEGERGKRGVANVKDLEFKTI